MAQELIHTKPSANNSIQNCATEESLKMVNMFNQATEVNNNYYLNSILKIPESHSIRYDIGSISKQMNQNEKQILRISDFSTKASLQKKPSPFNGYTDNLNKLASSQDISQWEEIQKKAKASEQKSFRPISKPQPLENPEGTDSEYLEDFECSMENEEPMEEMQDFELLEAQPLNFLSCTQIHFIKPDEKKTITLKKFVEKLQNRNKNFKIYTCDICNKNFNNHAALGGHKAKNHPHSSKSFIERKKTFELRKSERKKREFLRNF